MMRTLYDISMDLQMNEMAEPFPFEDCQSYQATLIDESDNITSIFAQYYLIELNTYFLLKIDLHEDYKNLSYYVKNKPFVKDDLTNPPHKPISFSSQIFKRKQ